MITWARTSKGAMDLWQPTAKVMTTLTRWALQEATQWRQPPVLGLTLRTC